MKLNLGCGKNILVGYTNIDQSKLSGVDKVLDLNKPTPYPNNSVDEIVCYNTLEHLDNPIQVLKEMHRLTNKGGIIKLRLPYCANINAFTAITHKHFFALRSFDMFDTDTDLSKEYGHEVDIKFKILKKEIVMSKNLKFLEKFINSISGFYERHLCWICPAEELYFELEVIK